MKSKLVKFLEVEEIHKLQKPMYEKINEIKNKNNLNVAEKILVRDFAIINLIYACALRISEVTNLKIEHIDLDRKELVVLNGKGGDRLVPIPKPTIDILKLWLLIRPENQNNLYFFCNIKGTTRPEGNKVVSKPLTKNYFNKLFKKMAEETGVKLKDGSIPHPHTLRHSRAMEIYDNSIPLEVVQKLLGHKNLVTTQVYAQVRDERVKEVQDSIVGGILSI